MDMQLHGKTALVVGGEGFIGVAVVARLREEGATVVVASRSTTDGVVLDGRDADSVQRAVDAVLAEHGRIDALVVTAAPAAQTLDPARSGDPDQVLDALDGKAMVFLRAANAVIPRMRDAGCTHVIMEVSSHSLVLDRVHGIRFAVGAFTNLTQDHLDFHKTMEEYRDRKSTRLNSSHSGESRMPSSA